MIRAHPRWWAAVSVAAMVLGACTSTAGGSAEMGAPVSRDADKDGLRSDTWLSDATRGLKAGCSAAAAVDGTVVWAAADGLADIDAGRSLTTTTRFDIADAGHQFIATSILLLAEDGRLRVTDPLSGHLSGLPAWAEQVTLSQLLHQNSGVPAVQVVLSDAGFTGVNPATEQDALQLVNYLPARFTPGAFFESNDTNYLLLAEVAQAVSGQSMPTLLRSRVFAPMSVDIAVRPQDPGEVATAYGTVLGQLQPSAPNGLFLAGRGLMFASPSELVRWADNYRTGTVGGPELPAAATRDTVPIGPKPGVPSFGAGIYVRSDGSLEVDGPTPGGETYLSVSPDRHTAVAFSCNQQDRPDLWDRRISDLRQIWFGIS